MLLSTSKTKERLLVAPRSFYEQEEPQCQFRNPFPHIADTLGHTPRVVSLVQINSDWRSLLVKPGAVIVVPVALLFVGGRGGEPRVVVGEPALDAGVIGGGPALGAGELVHGVNGLGKAAQLRDAHAFAGVQAGFELRKVQIGMHGGGGREEPVAHQQGGVPGITFIAGEVIA